MFRVIAIIGFVLTNKLPQTNENNFIYVAIEQFKTKEAKEILEEINTLIKQDKIKNKLTSSFH